MVVMNQCCVCTVATLPLSSAVVVNLLAAITDSRCDTVTTSDRNSVTAKDGVRDCDNN